MLLDGDTARVADFGLASAGVPQAAGPVADTTIKGKRAPLTGAGAIMGTPAYMVPETAHGAHEVEASADLFSLGVMAYQLLAKRMPHAVPPIWVALADQEMPPVTPLAELRPDLPVELTAALDSCLAEVPEQRPSAAAVAAALC